MIKLQDTSTKSASSKRMLPPPLQFNSFLFKFYENIKNSNKNNQIYTEVAVKHFKHDPILP